MSVEFRPWSHSAYSTGDYELEMAKPMLDKILSFWWNGLSPGEGDHQQLEKTKSTAEKLGMGTRPFQCQQGAFSCQNFPSPLDVWGGPWSGGWWPSMEYLMKCSTRPRITSSWRKIMDLI
jgi:hypothetical protein